MRCLVSFEQTGTARVLPSWAGRILQWIRPVSVCAVEFAHMPSQGTRIDVIINARLFSDAQRAARTVGLPLRTFLSEVIESAIADRRCRALPPPKVPADPPTNPLPSAERYGLLLPRSR
jgi:hypothetical protein